MTKIYYPINIAMDSIGRNNPNLREAIMDVQLYFIDDTYVQIPGVPYISIADFSIQLQEITGLQAVRTVELMLSRISKFIRVNFNRRGKDARDALKWIAAQDKRLAVWCACQVARESLKYVTYQDTRQLRGIVAAEGWVRGDKIRNQSGANITEEVLKEDARNCDVAAFVARRNASQIDSQVGQGSEARTRSARMYRAEEKASEASYFCVKSVFKYTSYGESPSYIDSTSYIIDVADRVADATACSIAYSGPYAKELNPSGYLFYSRIRDIELRRLTGVVADAILTFPV